VPVREQTVQEAVRARDPVALRQIVDQHGRRLYRAARGMGFSAGDAEDLAQDVFVTFLETIERFEGRSEVGTWLFGILIRKAQERRRARAREELSDTLDEAFEACFNSDGSWRAPPIPADRLVAATETAAALRECLVRLPDQYREVFQLRQVDNLPAASVSQVLGCTINHVNVMFHRARVRLRACLEAKGWGRSR
jgi:RNA polymerase sigma factor (sigma-70 family)